MKPTSMISLFDGVPVPEPAKPPARPPPRGTPTPPPLARAAVTAAALVTPARTARALARRFLTPRRVRLDAGERAVLATAERIALSVSGHELAAYAWGTGGPTVLLVHGWSSAAGQLSAFVRPLRQRGFRVVAFDAPAHGASPGSVASVIHIAEAILAMGRAVGPLHAVIAHSAGATATARAVRRGLAAGRLALVSPWTRPQTWIDRFAGAFGLSASMRARLVAAVEAEAGDRLSTIELEAIAPAVRNATLVVHDRDDALVDIAGVRSAAAALPGGTLVETRGLGHAKILRAPEVVERMVRFVAW
jgi:pimeloyl-ACP methyl ester carboxylesterase